MNKMFFYAFTLGAFLTLPLWACGGDEPGADPVEVTDAGDIDTNVEDAGTDDASAACVSPALNTTCAGKCGYVIDDCGETVDCKEGEFCGTDQNCLAIDATNHLGECVDKCTKDDDCKKQAACQTESGICFEEGTPCLGHNNCGDSQICDVSVLDGIYGKCAKGERPSEFPACGAPSNTLLGTDCEMSMAIDADNGSGETISLCSCACTSNDDCPETLPKCSNFAGMCITP